MNGITYFRLTSQYPGDVTKNCGLTGAEIDNNFNVLEGRDVKTVEIEDGLLKVILYNGNVLYADLSTVCHNGIEELSFDFDKDNGILTINIDGTEQKISGFLTSTSVYTDGTIKGNGSVDAPLGLSKAYITGMYKPVDRIWDIETDGKLPSEPVTGDRFLVKDKISSYGRLYDYEGVMSIACELAIKTDGWRIPTKADWDDMLNAIEPMRDKQNHNNPSSNINLGDKAGLYLKSTSGWDIPDTTTCGCGRPSSVCNAIQCANFANCTMHADNQPTDKYHFNAKPTGFVDENNTCAYSGKQAPFWTATLTTSRNSAYAKRLDWNKTTVYQDIVPTSMHYALRLVKDYDGTNLNAAENILDGMYKTVTMPSAEKGMRIWTATNFASPNLSFHSVEPCVNSSDATVEDLYYIAEWTGTEWVTSLFEMGDTVVVVNDGDLTNVEYRLYEDGLKDVNNAVVDAIYDPLKNELEEEFGNVMDLASTVDHIYNKMIVDGETNLVDGMLTLKLLMRDTDDINIPIFDCNFGDI